MSHAIRTLAVVGASARAAATSATRSGYEVASADLFADADLSRIARAMQISNYPMGLVEWLASADVDAWLYTGALENEPELIDAMAAIRPLLGNGGAALGRVRDPLQLQTACRQRDIAFP